MVDPKPNHNGQNDLSTTNGDCCAEILSQQLEHDTNYISVSLKYPSESIDPSAPSDTTIHRTFASKRSGHTWFFYAETCSGASVHESTASEMTFEARTSFDQGHPGR